MSGHIIKVTINHSHPPVWRRIVIPEKITFGNLHVILQAAFGWENDHMHDFSFPDGKERVGIDSSYGELPEDRICVDEYLKEYKWILYTYDFGDNWEHKIVLEKTDDTYENRYAAVLKYKGDNFEEDCGGVWIMYEEHEVSEDDETSWRYNRPEFSMEKVNHRLQDYTFPVSKVTPLKNHKRELDQIKRFISTMRKHPEKGAVLQQIAAFDSDGNSETALDMAEYQKKPGKKSKTQKMSEAWHSFSEEMDKQTEPEAETGYRQMNLFGEEEVYEDEKTSISYSLKKVGSDKTWLQMAQNLNQQEAEDYCKYLQIKPDSQAVSKKEKENYLKKFQAKLLEHPEFILYVFEQPELDAIIDFSKRPEGLLEDNINFDSINRCLFLGLAEFSTAVKNKQHIGYLSLASDIGTILDKIQSINMKKEYKNIRLTERNLDTVLSVYGLMEISELQNAFIDIYGQMEETERFLIMVYWHCRMNGLVQTMHSVDGKQQYIAAYDIDVQHASALMNSKAKDVSYRKFKSEEMKEIAKDTLPAFVYWSALGAILGEVTDISKDKRLLYISKWDKILRNGGTLDSIEEEIIMLVQKEETSFWVNIYSALVSIAMHTCIAGLKGHSRYSLNEQYKRPLDDIPFFDKQYLLETPDEITAVTKLSEMPSKIQCEIYAAAYEKNDRRIICGFSALFSEIKVVNQELEFLYIHCLLEHNLLLKAYMELIKLENSLDKENDEKLIREVDEWMEEVRCLQEEDGTVPFVRTEKKVGRNDPCPCGSGKKYKKCCGKNV